jgi:hypothetical protein
MTSISFTNLNESHQLFGGAVVDQALKSTLNKLAVQGKTAAGKVTVRV